MKKRNIAAILALVLVLSMAIPLTAGANVPGFSVYQTTPVVTIILPPSATPAADGEAPAASATPALVEIVSADTGVAINIPVEALPAGTTGVSLSVERLSHNDPARAEAIETFREQGVRGSVASVVSVNLLDQNANIITQDLNGVFSLTIPVPRGVTTISIVDPVTGVVRTFRGTLRGGFLTFSTPFLGDMMLIRR